jgi:hypothetical protein
MAGTSIPTPNQYLSPLGSYYDVAYSYSTATNLIRDAIFRAIYDLAPKQYDALKILNMAPVVDVPLDEFYYKEKVFTREPVTVFGWVHGTATITLAGTYARESDLPVKKNTVLCDANGTPHIVTTVVHSAAANSSTIVIEKQTGGAGYGAGDFVATDILSVQSAIIGDGMASFANPERSRTVERYNYVQLFQRTQKWTTMELQKLVNAATTDIMDYEKQEKLDQLRLDLFSTFFSGTRGEFTVRAFDSSGLTYKAKAMNGVFPTMVGGGSEHTSVSLSGLQTAFESLAFSTNHKATGATRFIYSTDENLYEISKLYKEPGIMYTPTDKIADLNLTQYKIGSMNFVPVPCELFKENSVLPAVWENRILVLDQATLNRVVVRGIPAELMGKTLNKSEGSLMDYTIWWVFAQQSLKMNDVTGSFYIDIT